MAENSEDFLPEDIDEQIEEASQFKDGDRRDAEALAYLRSYYRSDSQQEQETLDRLWKRITGTPPVEQVTQTGKEEQAMENPTQYPQMPYGAGTMGSSRVTRPRRTTLLRRLSTLAAVIVLIALVGSLAVVFYTLRQNNGRTGSPPPAPKISTSRVPLKVTSVSMSVTPGSIANVACGTNLTVTYTAIFHANRNNAGGTVKFTYTTNNGRGQTPASLTFSPGQISHTFTFIWHGTLPADHTSPGAGGVQVTSPNQLTSALVAPTGQCTPVNSAQFLVTSVDMTVSPASIQGLACGTAVVVTYTATIHVAARSPGGTVQFTYTTDNGRDETPASIVFSPGQTSRSTAFTSGGPLAADHTSPGEGGIQITSPNQLTSALVAPTGQCTPVNSAQFLVTSVDMAVSPASIQGLACGTAVVVTYTATIHVAARSPGGTVQFTYTTNNGRSQTPASLTFGPGQTSRTFTFTWSGPLPADHTSPGEGGIQTTSPNLLTSTLVAPTGACQ